MLISYNLNMFEQGSVLNFDFVKFILFISLTCGYIRYLLRALLHHIFSVLSCLKSFALKNACFHV